MTKRLLAALGPAFLAAACGSALPTAPTTVPQPTGASSTPPTVGVGGPSPIPGTSISTDITVQGTVNDRDPACFPNWDASGRCRQHDLTMPADGTLLATVRWTSRGFYNPEVFLVTPEGHWVYSDDPAWPERQVSLPAKTGLTYRIVVISYGPFPDGFELTARIQS